jgi:AraC family transcriptional regulator
MGIFRPPQEKHSEDYYGRAITCLSADIDPEWITQLADHDIKLDRSIARQSIELTAFVARLNEEFDRSDKVSALAIEALMLEIAIEIASPDRKFPLKNEAPKWLSHATEYIHAEFTSALTVAGIANAVGVHPVHLTRVFRRFYNQSIPEYIQRLRVEHACRLMTVPEISLAEISAASGFSDQSHFCKTFKRIIKTKPADYRAAVATS